MVARMQYTKPMIDLVFQIRKAVPNEIKPQIKLSNPELLGLLLSAYPSFEDQTLRILVAKLMEMAGSAWPLSEADRADAPAKIYRGQTIAVDVHPNGLAHSGKKKTLIYRGRRVAEV